MSQTEEADVNRCDWASPNPGSVEYHDAARGAVPVTAADVRVECAGDGCRVLALAAAVTYGALLSAVMPDTWCQAVSGSPFPISVRQPSQAVSGRVSCTCKSDFA